MAEIEGGFWRLEHSNLARILARTDLSWETARVYWAVGDLTLGFGRERDILSIGQISHLAHVDHWHTFRALDRLLQFGLYGEEKVSTRKIIRWIVWPPPEILNADAPVGASEGTNGVGANDGASPGTKIGANGGANVGTHQEDQEKKHQDAAGAACLSRGAAPPQETEGQGTGSPSLTIHHYLCKCGVETGSPRPPNCAFPPTCRGCKRTLTAEDLAEPAPAAVG